MNDIAVWIMTLNEEGNLPGCIASAGFTDRIVVLDSGSTDSTREVAESLGAEVIVRELDDWSTQQNWALDNINFGARWLLQLDADERVDGELADALVQAARDPRGCAAFAVTRRDWFMGRPITRVQSTPRLVRFFRPEAVSFRRLVNPVAEVDGRIGALPGRLEHYPFSHGLSHWVERHLEYARLEAEEIKHRRGPLPSYRSALFARELPVRRMHQKAFFQRLPLRPFLKFFWLYFIRRGFLDGCPGLAYAIMQGVYEHWISLQINKIRQ